MPARCEPSACSTQILSPSLRARVAELFSDRYDDEELAQLARLLERLPA